MLLLGYYVDAAMGTDTKNLTVEEIAYSVKTDITDGVLDTGIKMGAIGEIGCSWPLMGTLSYFKNIPFFNICFRYTVLK